ncbi:spermidine resistance protein [Microbotryomycetes sp. JL221]|nr:spermidine resistance protein [Microbotryomycetes sp. JL221]
MSTNDSITVVDDSSPGPFEGPEKLLELWFSPSEHDVPPTPASTPARVTANGLSSSSTNLKPSHKMNGLRSVGKTVWDSMLDEVQCKVLSVIEGEDVDAYLLSESSMFVWPHKLILKTCGTTTLLLGIPTLLRIASEMCGFNGVWRCFYSRKTFMFPERQRGPHKDWAQEVDFLDQLFQNSSAYTVGRMNGDHWLLYLTPPQDDVLNPNALASSNALPPSSPSVPLANLSTSLSKELSIPHPNHVSAPSYFPPRPPSRPDQTLEILMTQLHPSACASFYHPTASSSTPYKSPLLATDAGDADAHALGKQLSDELGITALMPEATIDSFLFTPCGYSANAVQGDRYATIHVTPEPEYSYASFETNLDFAQDDDGVSRSRSGQLLGPQSLQELVENVLSIFKPNKMSITLFVSEEEEEEEFDQQQQNGQLVDAHHSKRHDDLTMILKPDLLTSYKRTDRIIYSYEGYSLAYLCFELQQQAQQ